MSSDGRQRSAIYVSGYRIIIASGGVAQKFYPYLLITALGLSVSSMEAA